ncbi:MAG: hypothetical protein ACR2IE_08340 [Candidatus Sumerlaeaceae bacterium]
MSPPAKAKAIRSSQSFSPTQRAAAAASSLALFYRHILPLGIVVIFFVSLRLTGAPIADIDAYYHIKMSEMIRLHGVMHTFPWLEFTILNKPYVDMHFLYHVINVPLTFFELETASKIAGAAWGILSMVALHVLLARLRVPYVGFWTLGILGASYLFLYRMNISRAPSASVAIQMWALVAFYEQRYRLLAVIGFIFVWLYQLFILMLPIAVIFTVVEYFSTGKVNKKYFGWSLLGIVLGLVFNPYFPHDFTFFYQHVFLAALNPAKLEQGQEWLPFASTVFVRTCWGAFVTLLVAVFFAMASGTRITAQSQAALLMSGMFLFAYVRSRRFSEYFVPYTMVASALVWRDSVAAGAFRTWRPRLRTAAVALITLCVIGGIGYNWNRVLRELRRHITPARYRGATTYIAQHSNPGDVICHSDWDDFPELFFHNTKNHYIVGLDPNLLYLADKTKYNVWKNISEGKIPRPAKAMVQHFRAKYALCDYMQKGFIAAAARDPGLSLCYQDSGSLVWKIDPEANVADRFEAEQLTPLAAAQPATIQWSIQNFTQMFGVPASKDRTVFIQTKTVGDYVEFAVPALRAGVYDVKVGYVTAADMGIVQWSCNGVACGEPIDMYSRNPHAAGLAEFGRLHLRQGENRIRAAVTGVNPKAIGRRIAVDYFQTRLVKDDQPTTATAPG